MLSSDTGDVINVNGSWGVISQPVFGILITVKLAKMTLMQCQHILIVPMCINSYRRVGKFGGGGGGGKFGELTCFKYLAKESLVN